MIKYPDYDRSILAVISSILKYYGYDNGHNTLKELDEKFENHDYKNVLLMLFDGMGVSTLNNFLTDNDFLMQNFKCAISSVCPSTTACAIPTIESGMAPIEHGWLGWDMYFKEYDANITVLKNTYQDSNEQIKGANVARKYLPYENVFEKIKKSTLGKVNAHDISKFSDTDEYVYSCEQMLQKVQEIANNSSRDFIYSYFEEPDEIMHSFGTTHQYVKENVRYINSLIYELAHSIKDSLIIVIADHGLVDTEQIYLEDYKSLTDMLVRKTSFESRAVNFFVKEGYKTQFKKEFNSIFSGKFILMSKEEILEKELFGKGKINSNIYDSIGDYIAFAISNIALKWDRSGTLHHASHAGLLKEEMEVPLIIIDTDDNI